MSTSTKGKALVTKGVQFSADARALLDDHYVVALDR